jgi:hypothetical protein
MAVKYHKELGRMVDIIPLEAAREEGYWPLLESFCEIFDASYSKHITVEEFNWLRDQLISDARALGIPEDTIRLANRNACNAADSREQRKSFRIEYIERLKAIL